MATINDMPVPRPAAAAVSAVVTASSLGMAARSRPANVSWLSLEIMMRDRPLDHVRTLLVAVDAGTFEAAARVLHVTPSAVSQRIKALEQRTGRVLLVRSKPLRPTESGVAVVRLARQLAWLEDNARAELGLTGAG